MSWFESQIKQRLINDADDLSDAFTDISRSVMSDKHNFVYKSRGRIEENAVNEMLHYFGEKPVKIPNDIKDLRGRIDYATAPYGIMSRRIKLTKGWYHDACGVMITRLKQSGKTVTLIPGKVTGYRFYDGELMKYVKITHSNSDMLDEDAYLFYKPLPDNDFTITRLLQYIHKFMSRSDVILWLIMCISSVSFAFNVPEIALVIFRDIVPMNEEGILPAACFWLIGIVISSYLIDLQKNVVTKKMSLKASSRIQAAGMMQLLDLPRSFFQEHSPGDLASRINLLGTLTETTVEALSVFAYVLITIIVCIHKTWINFPIFVHTVIVISVYTLITYAISIVLNAGLISKRLEAYTNESGVTYDTILGIQKIRLTGSESRAFSRWGRAFSERAAIEYAPKLRITLVRIAPVVLAFVGMFEVYSIVFREAFIDKLVVADFYSFIVAYGMLMAALTMLTNTAEKVASIKPLVDLISPILNAKRELSASDHTDCFISGTIELSHVSFRYKDDQPDVIQDLSLKINRGDYIGIVGTTGCGKSTLIRLMTGIEKPRMGAVYYDGTDINNIAPRSLHKNTGIVEQNGRLFQGSIISNIRIVAPDITKEEIWDVLEKAGVAEDIREMPMGIHTIISEGDGGLSGGQRQRIVIARALAHKPKILFFDEATSALDNITQKVISETLDSLDCTRVVIAHRLSTVKNCKRIIVMNEGKIIESGTYDELLAKKGAFAELAAKQLL